MREQESISGCVLAGRCSGGRVVYRGIRSLRGPAVTFPLVATISTGTLQLAQRTQLTLVNLTISLTKDGQEVITLPELAR
ncbi:hypothetical protein HNP00_004163 [Arthrobacter sp. AZCC_0090]|nr:hypothetical protein [Arthrobacter sp. AZCC_0090]